MSQFEFTRALLQAARARGLHTCLDTSGVVPFERYEELLDMKLVDLFLYDIKETDSDMHRDATGASLDLILSNLRDLDSSGAETVIRCPLIPGMNDRPGHLAAIAGLANELSHVRQINVLPYHRLGRSKGSRIGAVADSLEARTPDDESVAAWVTAIQAGTDTPVEKP